MPSVKELTSKAQQTAQASDGTQEMALAVAAVSKKVKVSVNPLKIDPDRLFLMSFRDVEIDEDGMTGFKSNLQHLLPKISSSIALIPEDPSENIGDVAELVRLWLLSV